MTLARLIEAVKAGAMAQPVVRVLMGVVWFLTVVLALVAVLEAIKYVVGFWPAFGLALAVLFWASLDGRDG